MDCFQCLIGLSSGYLLNQLSYRTDCGTKINNYCAHQKFELCMSCYQLPGNMIGENCVICAIRQEWLSLPKYSMQCHQVFDEMSSICDEMLFNLELRKCLLQLLTIGVR